MQWEHNTISMIFLPKMHNKIQSWETIRQTQKEIFYLKKKKKKEQPIVFKNALKGKERLNWVYFL